jgi:hypothetical protein
MKDIDELILENKMNEIYQNYIEIYQNNLIANIHFRIYCIKNNITYKGYEDLRSLEILLGNMNSTFISMECYLHHENPEKYKINGKIFIDAILEGYKILLNKVWVSSK